MNFSFADFINGNYDYDPVTRQHTGLWLRSPGMDISGGRITLADIDRLGMYPGEDVVTISGLRQDTFEYFIRTYGGQLKAIRFFKNKLVEDWSLLGTLPELEYVHFFDNQRIDRLWDMSDNRALTGLSISDFTRLHRLEGIERAPVLQYFEIGDTILRKTTVESLMPLAGTGIEELSFCGQTVEDNDLSFLLDMPRLRRFDFATNQFTTEQVAWIAANCPGVEGFALMARRDDPPDPYPYGKEEPRTMIVGKRKPYLTIKGNEARIARYDANFEKLKEQYRGVPYHTAFPRE